MTYIIAEPCITEKDGSCVEVCPVDCIYEGEDQFYIHPDECIDCGACVPECPAEAIFDEDEVPEQWEEYIELNARLAEEWADSPITEKKDALPDADDWKDVEDKRQHLSENPA